MVRRLLLFAHHDASGDVRPSTVQTLFALRPHVARARFLSTSPVSSADAARIRADIGEVDCYDNVGFDFGMWKRALAEEDLCDIDELVLTNSSVVAPFRSVGDLFDRMAGVDVEAWGLTSSRFPTDHLQSYFLALRAPVLRSAAFRAFFTSVLLYREKWAVIASYEIGLSVWLRQHGFRTRAAFPVEALTAPLDPRRRLWQNLDPSIAFAAELIDAGCPLVKVALLEGRLATPGASTKQRAWLALQRRRLVRAMARRARARGNGP